MWPLCNDTAGPPGVSRITANCEPNRCKIKGSARPDAPQATATSSLRRNYSEARFGFAVRCRTETDFLGRIFRGGMGRSPFPLVPAFGLRAEG